MKFLKSLFVLGALVGVILVLSTISVNAFTVTVTGTQVTVTYDEPTTNEDGTALVDLDHTSIYYDMGSGTVKAIDVPATSLTGGGTISQIITVPVLAQQEANVSIWATAIDLVGNESVNSSVVVTRIDRLKPSPPQ